MSLNITDGIFKIFNVAYPNQVADLLYPGGVNGTIGGFRNNDGSKRNQWEVTNAARSPGSIPQYTFINQEITTFAAILQSGLNETVVGSPTQNATWTVTVASDAGDEYSISHIWHLASYGWTLPDGRDGTNITAEPLGDPPAKNQLWKFAPVSGG